MDYNIKNNFQNNNQNNEAAQNSSAFIVNKTSMGRSTRVITALLIIIVILLMVIGMLIYRNVENEMELPETNETEKQDVTQIPSAEKEQEEKVFSLSKREVDLLYDSLPHVHGTENLDYHLFVSTGLERKDIDALHTAYDELSFRTIYYMLDRVDLSEENIVLHLRVAVYDASEDRYYKAYDQKEQIVLGTYNIMDVLEDYGGKYTLTFVKSSIQPYLDKIEFAK